MMMMMTGGRRQLDCNAMMMGSAGTRSGHAHDKRMSQRWDELTSVAGDGGCLASTARFPVISGSQLVYVRLRASAAFVAPFVASACCLQRPAFRKQGDCRSLCPPSLNRRPDGGGQWLAVKPNKCSPALSLAGTPPRWSTTAVAVRRLGQNWQLPTCWLAIEARGSSHHHRNRHR